MDYVHLFHAYHVTDLKGKSKTTHISPGFFLKIEEK